MKQIITISLLICSLLLAACTDARSIGIIGGADGPTAVYVGEKGEKATSDKWGTYTPTM